jgi:hypothetical protein
VAELGVAAAANSQLRQRRFVKRDYAQRMRRGSKVLLNAVLAALIVVNVVLLFLLLRPDRVLTARPSDQASGGGGSPRATSSPDPDASTNPTPSSRTIESVPTERLLLAVSSKTAWRATVGDCDTPGKIERSTNSGASWKRIVRTGPAPIVQIGALPSGDLFTIGGTGQSCAVHYASYANDGTVTASTTGPTNVWFPTPKDRDEINGPDGTQATPCSGHVIGLAPLDVSQALVVCEDGAAMSTRDSGKTWRRVAEIPDTLAVAAGNGTYWLAGTAADCDGITVRSLPLIGSNSTQSVSRCAPANDIAPGQVALHVSGDAFWIWVGSQVHVSTDAGRSWN